MPPSRPLLDFGAGLLIGLSIVEALFAAMEDNDAALSHGLLLTAACALAAGIGLKLIPGMMRRRGGPSASRATTAPDAGWKAARPAGHNEERVAESSKSYKSSRGGRSVPPPQDFTALHQESHGPATSDGDSRRL
ncbi:MAG: hypothetical protein ACRETU_07050 [Steroidobacterales bacterium]